MTTQPIGTIYLRVADLDGMLRFYTDVIGLQLQRRTDRIAYLGVGGADLLALMYTPNGRVVQRTTGLYHFALLVPMRVDLARTLRHLLELQTPLQGGADHLVSEAIYLADPEGNGIEIYRDRPREAWYDDAGQFQMGTVALDFQGLIGELDDQTLDWQGLPGGTVMGHLHLHVADIPAAEAFYRDLLGMDVMVNLHSATFLSYDGYHHHLGANTWAGSTPPPDDALGLDHAEWLLPDQAALDAVLARLDAAGYAVEVADAGVYGVVDPSQNRLALAVSP